MLDFIALGLVLIVVYNIFGDKIKLWVQSKITPTNVTKVVDVVANDVSKIHSAIDAWLQLRSLPSIQNDPTAIAAMDSLKGPILTVTPVDKK